ncbi:hypothetical protein ACEN9F_22635 [Duganella sp. CT11-25]|uniref:hypothetical protein n=1 Tax=unclassified Duganella TaxID=2636909 RepID=UPI0039AF521E
MSTPTENSGGDANDSSTSQEALNLVEKEPETPHSSSAEVAGLNMDGRLIGGWESRYPKEAIAEIRIDAWFVGAVLFVTLVSLVLVWNGTMHSLATLICSHKCTASSFDKYALFFLGGLLGGILFGIKYLYKAVARGIWNMDRRLWRIFSPFVSGGLALAVGAMIDSGIVGLTTNAHSASSYFSMGFITGYFADGALAKMQDVADTIFGSGRRSSSEPSSEK